MKRFFAVLIVPALLVLAFGQTAAGQNFVAGISGAGDTANMPDLQQPETLIKFHCGVNPNLWPNYCAPVSAANIWEYYDNM